MKRIAATALLGCVVALLPASSAMADDDQLRNAVGASFERIVDLAEKMDGTRVPSKFVKAARKLGQEADRDARTLRSITPSSSVGSDAKNNAINGFQKTRSLASDASRYAKLWTARRYSAAIKARRRVTTKAAAAGKLIGTAIRLLNQAPPTTG